MKHRDCCCAACWDTLAYARRKSENKRSLKEREEAALFLPNLAMLFTQPVSEFDQCTISKLTKDDQKMGSS